MYIRSSSKKLNRSSFKLDRSSSRKIRNTREIHKVNDDVYDDLQQMDLKENKVIDDVASIIQDAKRGTYHPSDMIKKKMNKLTESPISINIKFVLILLVTVLYLAAGPGTGGIFNGNMSFNTAFNVMRYMQTVGVNMTNFSINGVYTSIEWMSETFLWFDKVMLSGIGSNVYSSISVIMSSSVNSSLKFISESYDSVYEYIYGPDIYKIDIFKNIDENNPLDSEMSYVEGISKPKEDTRAFGDKLFDYYGRYIGVVDPDGGKAFYFNYEDDPNSEGYLPKNLEEDVSYLGSKINQNPNYIYDYHGDRTGFVTDPGMFQEFKEDMTYPGDALPDGDSRFFYDNNLAQIGTIDDQNKGVYIHNKHDPSFVPEKTLYEYFFGANDEDPIFVD